MFIQTLEVGTYTKYINYPYSTNREDVMLFILTNCILLSKYSITATKKVKGCQHQHVLTCAKVGWYSHYQILYSNQYMYSPHFDQNPKQHNTNYKSKTNWVKSYWYQKRKFSCNVTNLLNATSIELSGNTVGGYVENRNRHFEYMIVWVTKHENKNAIGI